MPEWREGVIGDLACGVRGVSYRPEHLLTSFVPNAAVLLRATNIQHGQITFEDVQHVPSLLVSEDQRLRKHDIAVCMSNGSKLLVGKSAPCKEEFQGLLTVGAFCSVFHPRPTANASFVAHVFNSERFRRHIDVTLAGSAINNLRNSDVERFPYLFPNFDEQSRIAAVLDTVDEAIASMKAVIAKVRQVRAGQLHDLLSRGLDAHGQLRDPIANPEQFQDSPLGQIPKDWRWSKFDEVLEGIDAGKSPDYPDYPAPPGEWGVLKVSAISPEGFRPHENKWVTKATHQVAAYQVRDGDLLISRSNTYELVGLVCLVENTPPRVILCDKTLRLRLKPRRGINPFFCLVLQSRPARVQIEINATGTSGSMKNISQDVIRTLRLAYPEVDEQRRILEALKPANDELAALQRELRKLTNLKSGLMTDLLTGRIRVPAPIGTTP